MKSIFGILAVVLFGATLSGAQSTANQQQSAEATLHEAFVGRQVLMNLDMPGTQKGVDLHFGHGDPIQSKDYESRMTEFGVALHKGDRATVTSIVVKNDHIEFHLDGGGYGTVHDDTGTVSARIIPESDEQVRLEKALKTETDRDRRRDLQDRLDHEVSRRNFLQSQENSAALVANQAKQQEIANRRLHGGSRFNLRWDGNIPSDQLSADAIRTRLSAYIIFDSAEVQTPQPSPMAQPSSPAPLGNDSLTALHQGMSFNDVQSLLGPGQIISQDTSTTGLLNQEMVYVTQSSQVHVTLVNGIVVRFAIESR